MPRRFASKSPWWKSPLLEIVRVHLGDLESLVRDADAVLDHQFRQPRSVDEHDAVRHRCGELSRLPSEARGGDEDALVRFTTGEGSENGLKLGTGIADLQSLGW